MASCVPLGSPEHVPSSASAEEMKEDHSVVAPHLRAYDYGYDAVLSSSRSTHPKAILPVVHEEEEEEKEEGEHTGNNATENINVNTPALRYCSVRAGAGSGDEHQSTWTWTVERARFDEISNVVERDHWAAAPFAPGTSHFFPDAPPA
jgi:hypothetical protein